MLSLSPPPLYFTSGRDKPGGRWEETREEGTHSELLVSPTDPEQWLRGPAGPQA